MVCGVDLWDVERYASAGSLTICQPCVDAIKSALDGTKEPGEVAVRVPVASPPVHGEAPDEHAASAIARAFARTFDSDEDQLDDDLEDAGELGPALAESRSRFAPATHFGARVDAIRFRTSDRAEVRFRVLMSGNPVGSFQGSAARSDGKWRVTRDTVVRLLASDGVGSRRGTRTFRQTETP